MESVVIPTSRKFFRSTPLLVLLCTTLCCLKADTLFVGFNTATPVQLYSTGGTYLQDFGPSGAIAVIPSTSTSYFVIQPGSASSTTITSYSGGQVAGASFTINNLIEDGAIGPNGSLWLSAFDGTVYQVSQSGTIETSWNTGFTHVGIAFDGTFVYTTQGDSGNGINKWSTAGAAAGTIATPFFGLYGIGYDGGDLWAGSTDFVYEMDLSGDLLSTLDLPGDSRTPGGAVHDGLELGPLPNAEGGGGGGNAGGAVPEPGSWALIAGGLLLLLLMFLRRHFAARISRLCAAAISCIGMAFGSVTVQLSPSVPSGAPVGTTVTWTASATDTAKASATFTYQFSVAPASGSLQVRRDYSSVNNYPWTPSDNEGSFSIQAKVKSSTGAVGTANASYEITSRIRGSAPVISTTNNPMVALYSLAPCSAGRTARVRFKGPGDPAWQATPFKTCTGTASLNFYIAGMRANTTYTLQHDVFNGPFDTLGPMLTFASGSEPAGGPVIASTGIAVPATSPNNIAYNVVLTAANSLVPFATDTQGHLIWYLAAQGFIGGVLTRPVSGGTFLGIFDDNSGIAFNNRLLQEYDLAGNLIRETNAAALTQQIPQLGTPITSLSHEIFRYPNGDTGLITTIEKVADQGAGPVDVVGDVVVILDSNLQVKWWWNAFDHLDVHRPAILGETCAKSQNGCPPLYKTGYSLANDWTHSNSLAPTPDGHLVLSVRHQDWVIKIDYAGGTGSGAILWKLGNDGDFRLNSSDPNAWFTHQHDVEFESNGLLSLFDNGNTRILHSGGNSRGQAWSLDQTNKVATPALNLDLGTYSFATGSAQLLSNGNYHYCLGFVDGNHGNNVEYKPDNTLQFKEDVPFNSTYRSFRMRSLYSVN